MDLDWLQLAVSLTGAYVIGSIPFGLVASKLCRTPDPRTTGSGNIGSTNVLRVSGKKAGMITLIGDAGKGFLVAWLAQRYLQAELAILLIAASVVLGHIFSVFLKFQGGKGVATALAAIGGLHLALGLTMTAVWLLAVWGFRYSSGGAITAFLTLPLFTYFVFSQSLSFVTFSIGISFLVIFRHKDNISRLLSGTEGKLSTHSS
ncbi:MAG: glycerol-3-phosphate acyltransferase [Nitrospirales bacterium]|nr:MAG: glycerol-3-phosphate acyltransferase [Nitrospirales bacterium]